MRIKRILIILLAAAVALISAIIPGLDASLVVRHYEMRSSKLSAPLRIALVTDLHSCVYGEEQSELIDALISEEPDIVLMCGDMFDMRKDCEDTGTFMRRAAELYPCYYVTGNHEFNHGSACNETMMRIASESGVIRLNDETCAVDVNGSEIVLCGADDGRFEYSGRAAGEELAEAVRTMAADISPERFSILMAHRPAYFDDYSECGFDLVLCGHEHGGQWRVPGIINGIYCHDEGLFPKYAGGMYTRGGTVMVVSRGLAKPEVSGVARIYNPCELVIVDVLPE